MVGAAAIISAFTVSLSPAVAHPNSQVRVEVAGLHATSALVVLHGGIASRGKWFQWVPLQRTGTSSWHAVLETPGLYGVYPVRLRVNSHISGSKPGVAERRGMPLSAGSGFGVTGMAVSFLTL